MSVWPFKEVGFCFACGNHYTITQVTWANPYASWSIESLKEYEDSLYDHEVAGEDVWFERGGLQ